MVRGFPGLAGDATALIGKALTPVWMLLKGAIILIARLKGARLHAGASDSGERL